MLQTLTKPTLYGIANRLELVKENNGVIEIDENQLDLFDYYNEQIPEWKPPKGELPSYNTLKQVHLDIETTGLDPNVDRTILIGLMNESGRAIIIDAYDDERMALIKLFNILEKKKPDILNVFKGFEFDLPFIIRRCEILGISHPFWLQKNPDGTPSIKIFNTAQKNSLPAMYQPIWLTYRDKYSNQKHQCAIIDSYHQVLCWDFVKRKLTEHNLKAAPRQLGLRKVDRIELSYPQMLECIEKRDFDLLRSYLLDDLKDTKLLGDFLIPAIYYQKMFLDDWNLQSLSASGNGSKWNSILKKEYPNSNVKTSEKKKFKGGLTLGLGGLYHGEISKFDVASLYPSVMLLFGVCSRKDVKKMQLQILNYQRTERLILKDIAETTGDKEADQMQGCMKAFLNSGYGGLGTTGIEFNDYSMAAMVTAYARGILRLMFRLSTEFGGRVIQIDTDAVCVHHEIGKAGELLNYLNERMPQNLNFKIVLDNEWTAKAFFVPPSDKQNYDVTLVSERDEGHVVSGLRKNYIIVMKEKLVFDKKNGEYKVKYKEGELKYNGRYRKRDRYELEKTFQPNLIQIFSNEGEYPARVYYRDIRKQLVAKTYPVSKLLITKKIGKGEKKKIDAGLGKAHDEIKIYHSREERYFTKRTGAVLKNFTPVWTKDPEEISWEFYIDVLDKQFHEVFDFVDKGEKKQPKKFVKKPQAVAEKNPQMLLNLITVKI